MNCYRVPGSDSVDTKQSTSVNRDNITGTNSVVDRSTSEMHLAVKTRYGDILPDSTEWPYRNVSATHSHSDPLLIVMSVDVCSLKKFNHKDEGDVTEIRDVVCERRATQFWWANLNDRDLLEDLDVDGRVILKWNLNDKMRGTACLADGPSVSQELVS